MGGGGRVGGRGVRVDVYGEVKFFENSKSNWGGGVGSGGQVEGVQGRCEQRSEVFVKIRLFFCCCFLGGRVRPGGRVGGSGWM